MKRFVDFMPSVYARLYGTAEMAEHAAIAERRGERLVHAEMWESPQGPRLCVVAEDRPGLLAHVTDALLAQGMAIQSARAFCREISRDRIEAVDFLELQALDGPPGLPAHLDENGIETFAAFLSEIISNDLVSRPSSWPRPDEEPPTRVYFERQSPAEGRHLLVVEAPDSSGLLHAVTSALHAQGMRIIACEIRTLAGRARDRFEVEPNSARVLKDADLCDVQLAVLDALPSRR
jgi:UTP:GlnB (protein PII) uridylyltransferase